MGKTKADFLAKLCFYSTENDGLQHLYPFDNFKTIGKFEKENRSIAILANENGESAKLGEEILLPVKFIFPQAKDTIRLNEKFFIWAGKNIGEEIILEIYD